MTIIKYSTVDIEAIEESNTPSWIKRAQEERVSLDNEDASTNKPSEEDKD